MIGKTLAHYEVVATLGKGGMGEVYVAQDTKLQRRVALKVLPKETAADPERRSRFEREARAVAALSHPNIVTVHSVEEADGVHFITMELVEGRTLSKMLPRNGFPLGELLNIAIPLADAVSSAHRSGITHRDLKPDNIMVDNEGRLRVLDFGLAKLHDPVGSEEGMTQAPTAAVETEEGKILGTVAYMSPEQAVFSLGTILHEMATGERPFRGDTKMSTIGSILKDQPASVTERNPSLPRHLGRIVRRCLAKDPDRRYQTALDLRNELEHLKAEIDSGEHGAEPGQAGGSGRRWVWVSGAVIAVLAVVLSVIVLWESAERGASPEVTIPGAGVDLRAAQPSSGGPSIAVLPFSNAGGDPDQEYFSDGLTEDIITELSHYRELSVIAHSSTTRFKDSDVDVREIGASLGARYVLLGSIRKTAQRIRVRVQLSDANDGRLVWGSNYERDLTARDLYELQDELTQQVVNAIAGS
jgi:non-specific serine/threonine protein kinase